MILVIFLSSGKDGRFEKQVEVDLSFLKNETKPVLLFFFGYAECSDVCPTALGEIKNIYEKTDTKKLSFYFINLQAKTEENVVKEYAKSFHKDFNGIYLNKKEIFDLVNKLKIKFSPNYLNNNEIDHLSYLYLFIKNKNGKYMQKYIYTKRPFNINYLTSEIKKIQENYNDL